MIYSKNGQTYHVFDFENFNEKGLTKFKAALKRAGAEVTGITATNRPVKKDGILTKSASLFFLNGQKSTLIIGGQGDVVSMKVNGKAYPVDTKDIKSLANSLQNIFELGQQSFDKSLAKKLAKANDDAPNDKPANRPQADRIKEIDELIAEAMADLEKAKAELDKTQAESTELRSDIRGFKNKIADINKTITSLNAELKKMETTA